MAKTQSTKEELKRETPTAPVSLRSETQRMANIGIEVHLKALGGESCEVRELPLEELLRLGPKLINLISLFTDAGDQDQMTWILSLIQRPEVLEMMQALASASTKLPVETFHGMGISDWLKLFAAFKDVTDWEEMKAAFFHLVPPSLLAGKRKA